MHLELTNRENEIIKLITLVISLTAIFASYFVVDQIYEQMPHLEDEIAYSWQATVFANGQLSIPSPKNPSSFMIPFVVDYNGQRFGKYPPGWPILLAFGVRLGIRSWINPLLAGLAVWLTWRLGQKLFDNVTSLLAAFLMASSPFFLLISGSLLSHSWSLVLTLAFAIAWLDTFNISVPKKTIKLPTLEANHPPKWITISIAGLSLGLLALTRPLTGIGISLAFFIHGVIIFWHGNNSERSRLLSIGLLAITVGAMFPIWQYVVTGKLFLNPYTLWLNYDKVGFGQGYGRLPGGHNIFYAIVNLIDTIYYGWRDLIGWSQIFWLYLLTGIWIIKKNHYKWLLASMPLGLILVYLGYWTSSPRYFFEGIPALSLITASGVIRLLDWSNRKMGILHRVQTFIVLFITLVLIVYNITSYAPHRIYNMYNLYNINRSRLLPFQNEHAITLTPALVIVHVKYSWTDYGTLLDIENPWLTSPFIFAISKGEIIDEDLATHYPDRSIIHYYPDQPTIIFIHRFPRE